MDDRRIDHGGDHVAVDTGAYQDADDRRRPRVSWGAEPELIDLEQVSSSVLAHGRNEWQVPSVAYLHLVVAFTSACLTRDALSLGYVAVFLIGGATLTERAAWSRRTRAWQACLRLFPFDGACGGSLLLNLYVVCVGSFAAAALVFHASILVAQAPDTAHGDDGTGWQEGAQQGSQDGRMFMAIIAMLLDGMGAPLRYDFLSLLAMSG